MKFLPLYLSLTAVALASAALAKEDALAQPLAPDAVVAEITTRNPELQFYRDELAAAQANARIAATRAPAELGVQGGTKRVSGPGGLAAEGVAWSISVSQTFEWSGRLALRKSIANADVALAQLGLARFEAALAARARTLAFGLQAAQAQAEATREVADRYAALKEVFLARDPAGLTPQLETRVIEAQELALQRRATEAALAAQAALVELNQLRGAPVDAPLALAPARIAFHPAPGKASLLAAARENNFEFRAKRLELEQQGYMVRLAQTEGRPSFTVSPYVSQEKAGDTETIAGLGLSLPLPLGDRPRATQDAAAARQRQAQTAVLLAERELEREILAAIATFTAKQAEVARWAPDAAERFREAAALADRHYRLGAVPLTTYVELQNSYLDAVESLLATRREALESGLQLQLLTGIDFNGVEVTP